MYIKQEFNPLNIKVFAERYCHGCHKIKQIKRIEFFGEGETRKKYETPLFSRVSKDFKESVLCKSCDYKLGRK